MGAFYGDPALVARTFDERVSTDLVPGFNVLPDQTAPVVRIDQGKLGTGGVALGAGAYLDAWSGLIEPISKAG